METSDRLSSLDITAKMSDRAEQNLKSEKYKSLEIPTNAVMSHSPFYNNGLCNESSNSTNYSISSDEINSCNSSDNYLNATTRSSNNKANKLAKRISPPFKQTELENETLSLVDHCQIQGGEY